MFPKPLLSQEKFPEAERGSIWPKLRFTQARGTETYRNNKTSVALPRNFGLGILQSLDDMVSNRENIGRIFNTNVINLMIKQCIIIAY